MATATVSTKGWIVIPAEMRRKFNIRPGDVVHIFEYGGVISVVPALKDPVEEAMGMFKGGESLTKSLLEDRARERKREAQKAEHVRAG